MTLLRGQVLLNQGRLEQKPGYGRYLARTRAGGAHRGRRAVGRSR